MKDTRKEMKTSDLFENAFENAAIGMALVSLYGEWIRVNRSLCHIVGYSEDELLASDFQTITHPADLETDVGLVQDVLNGKIKNYELEKRYIHKNGSIVWVNLAVSLMRDDEDQAQFFVAQIQDITKKKASEDQLSLVVSNISDGFWDWHIQDDYEYMSPTFWAILGFQPEEKRHHPSEWQELIDPEDLKAVLRNFDLHVKTRGVHPFCQEVRYRHKDGSLVWVLCRGKVIEWNQQSEPVRMIGTHTDITELKKISEELHEEKMKQAQSTRLSALGELAGGIAHEINNPLAILAGQARMLSSCIQKEEIPLERVTMATEAIENTVDRIESIIRGLRAFSRDGRADEFEEFLAEDFIDEILSISQDRSKRERVQVSYSSSVSSPRIFAQRTMLAQVLINLLNNAFDACQNCSEKWVKIHFTEDEQFSRLTVEDSGNGIDSEIKKKLMTPFFTTKKPGQGTGIGLSISQNIVDKHHGNLFLDETAKNTKFIIEIPRNVVDLRKAR